ncbi:MAG: PD40 domain-containing protein, partial [Flavobacteriales bacterium]|nr:PD40 domain-containing protein [Flavobacteriales bacterium]
MRQILKIFLVLLASQLMTTSVNSQELSDLSTGILKKTATGSMRVGDVHTAIEVYTELHSRNPNQIKYLEQLENLNVRIHNYQAALDALEQIAALNDSDVQLEFRRAEYQKQLGEYDKAKASYQRYIDAVKRNSQLKPLKKLAQRSIAGCDSALLWIEKQDNIEIQRLSEEVNGPHIEFNPIQISESQLIYGALKEDSIKKFHQDSLTPKRTFYKAINKGETWESKGVWKEELLDSLQDVGNGCFSSDSSKFFFSKCARSWEGEVICKIWMAEIAGNGDFINLRELNEEINAPGSSNSQPTIGKETRRGYDILYFVSNRDGGRGGQDIWAAVYDERKKQFRAPKNIGRKINSEFDDVTPFFDQKTKKLYFSSERPEGMGGLDVYSSRGEYRRWVDPKNVGFPINSNAD